MYNFTIKVINMRLKICSQPLLRYCCLKICTLFKSIKYSLFLYVTVIPVEFARLPFSTCENRVETKDALCYSVLLIIDRLFRHSHILWTTNSEHIHTFRAQPLPGLCIIRLMHYAINARLSSSTYGIRISSQGSL